MLTGFVVVNCFPKSDPDIQQSEAAAKAANKTVGDKRPQSRRADQEVVIGPFRPPGEDKEQDSHGRASKHQQQDENAAQPKLKARVRRRVAIA